MVLVYTISLLFCMPIAQCEDGEVKLVSGQLFSDRLDINGYVLVCSDMRWNAICNSHAEANAIAICNQLGYSEGIYT